MFFDLPDFDPDTGYPSAGPRRGFFTFDDEPVPYEDFNSGLSFEQIREELYQEQMEEKEKGQYMFVSRSTVLGRMHQRKQERYRAYLAQWDRENAA